MDALLKSLMGKVINGKTNESVTLVEECLSNNIETKMILDNALIPAMDIVGEKFQKNEFFIPELLVAAKAMEASLAILKPHLIKENVKPVAVALLGTVKGDLHDIGKNIVAAMLKGGGFEIIDLGVDVSPQKFVDEIKKKQVHIVGLSALITTTMLAMKTTINTIVASGLRNNVKIMVGGAPLTESFAEEIGADGYAADAAGAVRKARELLSQK